MTRVYNLSPGPSMFPEPVLERARAELLDLHATGMSVLEMSHRGKDFVGIVEEVEATLRELLSIPQTYKILFPPGSATGQFAVVPLNLRRNKAKLSYLSTGL